MKTKRFKKVSLYVSKYRYLFITVFLAVILVSFSLIKKIIALSVGPSDKDCHLLSPFEKKDPQKITRLTLNSIHKDIFVSYRNAMINDASCLNNTQIYGVVQIKSESDVTNALIFAKENDLQITPAGIRHSMGGQAFYKGSLVLDMTGFNAVKIHTAEKTMTVQSGATWHDIQKKLHPKFAIKAMQSTDIFTVGGSLSVNAHGMDHTAGSIAESVKSLRVLLSDGSIRTASNTENEELFRHVIGGYGLFGIILDAEIEITDNEIYDYQHEVINYKEFPETFTKIIDDPSYGLFYGHLSTSPGSFLKEMLLYTYQKTPVTTEDMPPLPELDNVGLQRFILNSSKYGTVAKRFKWFAEKHLEPLITQCTLSRNQAQRSGEACLVSRNEPMHDSVKYLRNNIKDDTDILQEYFIPRDQFISFIDATRDVLKNYGANVLNASIRVVKKEDIALNYAPQDSFALVLYLNQKTDAPGNENMRLLTQAMINTTLQHGGRFFLPYQLYYTKKQLHQSYPEIQSFFAMKEKYDPQHLFTNTFYETYKNN